MNRIILLLIMLFSLSAGAQHSFEAVPDFGMLRYVTYDPDNENVLYGCSGYNHIVRSTDNGVSWHNLYSHPNRVGQLKVLPGSPNICFTGLSPNEEPWFYVLDAASGLVVKQFQGPNSDYSYAEMDFAVDGATATTILMYAGYEDQVGEIHHKVFYTADGGENWELHYDYNNNDGFLPQKVAINPADPLKLYIALGHSDTSDVGGGLLFSADGGATWSQALGNQFLTALAVNPMDGDDIMTATQPDPANGQSQKLLRSPDGGQTWTEIPMMWTASETNSVSHIDYNRAIAGSIFVVDFNEIAYTSDNGETWEHTVHEEQVYITGHHISSDPFEEAEAILMGDYQSLRTLNGGISFSRVESPFYNTVNVGVRTFNGQDHLYYSGDANHMHKSYEDGQTGIYDIAPGVMSIMRADPYVEGRLLLHDYDFTDEDHRSELYISSDHGATKTLLLSLLASEDNYYPVLLNCISDPTDPDLLYASLYGMNTSRLYRFNLADPGAITHEIIPLPQSNSQQANISNILHFASEGTNSYLIVNLGNTLYRSADEGLSWTEYFSVPAAWGISDIDVSPLAHNMVALATDNGVYISEDSGLNWSLMLDTIAAGSIRFSDVEENVLAVGVMAQGGSAGSIMYYNGSEWFTINQQELSYMMATSMDFSFSPGTMNAYVGTLDMGVVKYSIELEPLSVGSPGGTPGLPALWPNPVKDYLMISLEEKNLSNVSVYALTGQKMLEGTTLKLDLRSLSDGLYIVRIRTKDGHVMTKKIIKG